MNKFAEMHQLLKDIFGAAENGEAYSPEELMKIILDVIGDVKETESGIAIQEDK